MGGLMQPLIDAASVGSLYALEALGIGLLFGIMRLANFALGAVTMLAAYALYLTRELPLPVSILVALLVAVGVSLVLEAVVFRRLKGVGEATLFIVSFAIAFGVEHLALVVFGANTRGFALSPWLSESTTIGGARVSHLSLVTIVTVLVLLGLFVAFLRLTDTGIRLRAASDDFRMATMLGVAANRVIGLAFALSGVLCAAAAVIVVGQVGGVAPSMGSNVIIIALLGAVIGGMDRLSGAAVGGFCVGVALSLLNAWLPLDIRPYRDAFAILAVILVLIVRPHGLLPGATLRERV